MSDTDLIVSVSFLQESKVAFETIFALPLLYFLFHSGYICRELEGLAIAEPKVVIRLTFHELHTFCFKGGIEVVKGFAEEMGEQEEGGALVEALVVVSELDRAGREEDSRSRHGVPRNIFHP
jgi:hypothetical protein